MTVHSNHSLKLQLAKAGFAPKKQEPTYTQWVAVNKSRRRKSVAPVSQKNLNQLINIDLDSLGFSDIR